MFIFFFNYFYYITTNFFVTFYLPALLKIQFIYNDLFRCVKTLKFIDGLDAIKIFNILA